MIYIITLQEIIQNADDAKATEVKFILDHRELHTLSPNLVGPHALDLLNRFQGPALFAYNNAGFTESDWEGIQNLQQSGKAKDPFKVGKFGIGFNSVYHITGENNNNCHYNTYFCIEEHTVVIIHNINVKGLVALVSKGVYNS